MAMACQTAHYMWYEKDMLGRGATADVFMARCKSDGQQVAVKVFNKHAFRRPLDVQRREFDLLKQLDHGNIVRLIAIEPQISTGLDVVVMENCTGGSLYTYLEEPENVRGLPEDELVCCLDHIASGMKHLREHNVVHRDVKPGNILRAIGKDGRSIFKLTDFGGARELPEGGQFFSLVGTEEYLHPDLYERAILRTPQTKKFTASVDLWSMGATLYHTATGMLPFRPFKGRDDVDVMHRMTTKKDSGVISGVQEKERGEITWYKDLPDTCNISKCLQAMLTPLIAGLMECDHDKIMTFDKFFQVVDDIMSRRFVHMFHVETSEHTRLYLKETDTFKEMQGMVAQFIGMEPKDQILLADGDHLTTVLKSPDEKIGKWGLPPTSQEYPILLLSEKQMEKATPVKRPDHTRNPPAKADPLRGVYDIDVTRDTIFLICDVRRLVKEGQLGIRLTDRAIKILCQLHRSEMKHIIQWLSLYDFTLQDVLKKEEALQSLVSAAKAVETEAVKEAIHKATRIIGECKEVQREGSQVKTELEKIRSVSCVHMTATTPLWSGQERLSKLEKENLPDQLSVLSKECEEIEQQFEDERKNRTSRRDRMPEEVRHFNRMKLGSLGSTTVNMLSKFLKDEVWPSQNSAHRFISSLFGELQAWEDLIHRKEKYVQQQMKVSQDATTVQGELVAYLGEQLKKVPALSAVPPHVAEPNESRSSDGSGPRTHLTISEGGKNPSPLGSIQPTATSTDTETSTLKDGDVSANQGPANAGTEAKTAEKKRNLMKTLEEGLRNLHSKNEELKRPMQENTALVKQIKDLVQKSLPPTDGSEPQSLDDFTFVTPEDLK